MKKRIFAILVLTAAAVGVEARAAGGCWCGEVPERANDFCWENERVGFRAYGPKDPHVWSGIDVFSKLPDAEATCGYVLKNNKTCGNWHVTPYKGILDDYTLGPGRGVGGVALRKNGEWLPDYGDWVACRVVTNTAEVCSFELDYRLPIGGTMTLGITLMAGSSLFCEAVTLSRDVPTDGLEIGVGLDLNPAREHEGDVLVDAEQGIVSLFEKPRNYAGRPESRMAAIYAVTGFRGGVTLADEPNGAKMLMTGPLKKWDAGSTVLVVFAGADGTECGTYKSAAEWHGYVRKHRAATTGVLGELFKKVLDSKLRSRAAPGAVSEE